jgi:catechol 2,3-dioxygenase-like lactoylglutathione lyase family enzyme
MRGATLFVAGLVVGVTAQVLVAQNTNTGVVMMNHVGINVPDIPEAINYYASTMGYKEAFRANNPDGTPRLVYMQISKTTFLELQQSGGQRPAGFTHYGLHVENAKSAIQMFRQRGATVSDANASVDTKAVLANITDPYMGRIELAELPAESLQRTAIDRWK